MKRFLKEKKKDICFAVGISLQRFVRERTKMLFYHCFHKHALIFDHSVTTSVIDSFYENLHDDKLQFFFLCFTR